MDELLARLWNDMISRIGGPMSFRFVLQPAMAILLAARDGVRDAREGRSPYFWELFARPGERTRLLREGLNAVMRVLVLAAGLDFIYQITQFKTVHPLELVIISLMLAFAPYLLLRGPFNRLAQFWTRDRRSDSRQC
jgi:hypothetical protein